MRAPSQAHDWWPVADRLRKELDVERERHRQTKQRALRAEDDLDRLRREYRCLLATNAYQAEEWRKAHDENQQWRKRFGRALTTGDEVLHVSGPTPAGRAVVDGREVPDARRGGRCGACFMKDTPNHELGCRVPD